MNVNSRLLPFVLVALSISAGSATEVRKFVCPITPTLEVVSAVAPAAGAYPVWAIDGSFGRWGGPDAQIKTAWILARDNPGDLTVLAQKIDSDDRALFKLAGRTDMSDRLVIADADHPQMIPGDADADMLRMYSFRSSGVIYPSAGCWEFLVTYGESQSSIIVELAED